MGLGSCDPFGVSTCGQDGRCCSGSDMNDDGTPDTCTETNDEYCRGFIQTTSELPVEFAQGEDCSGAACNVFTGACCLLDNETGLHLCTNRDKDQCETLGGCWKGGTPGDGGNNGQYIKCEDYRGPNDQCEDTQAPFYCGICNDIDPIGPKGCCMRPVQCKTKDLESNGLGGGFRPNADTILIGGAACPSSNGNLSGGDIFNEVEGNTDFPALPQTIDQAPQSTYDIFGYTFEIISGDEVFPSSVEDIKGTYDGDADGRVRGNIIGDSPACVQMGLFECCGPPPDFPYCGLPYDKMENQPDFPGSPNAPAFYPNATDSDPTLGECIGAGCPGVTQDTFWEWRGETLGEGVPENGDYNDPTLFGNKYVYPDLNHNYQKYYREINIRKYYPDEYRIMDETNPEYGYPISEERSDPNLTVEQAISEGREHDLWENGDRGLTGQIIWPPDIPRNHVVLGMPYSFYDGNLNRAFIDNSDEWAPDSDLYSRATGVNLSGVWPYNGEKDQQNRGYFSPYLTDEIRQWMVDQDCVDPITGIALSGEKCFDILLEGTGYTQQDISDAILNAQYGDISGGPSGITGENANRIADNTPLFERYTNGMSIQTNLGYYYGWGWGGFLPYLSRSASNAFLRNYHYGNYVTVGTNNQSNPLEDGSPWDDAYPNSSSQQNNPYRSMDLKVNLDSINVNILNVYYRQRCNYEECMAQAWLWTWGLGTFFDFETYEANSEFIKYNNYLQKPYEQRHPRPIYDKQELPNGTDNGGITLPALIFEDGDGNALDYEDAIPNPTPGYQFWQEYLGQQDVFVPASYGIDSNVSGAVGIPLLSQWQPETGEAIPYGSFEKRPLIDYSFLLDQKRYHYTFSDSYLAVAKHFNLGTLQAVYNGQSDKGNLLCGGVVDKGKPISPGMKLWRKGDCQIGHPGGNPDSGDGPSSQEENSISSGEIQAHGSESDDNPGCGDRGAMGSCEFNDSDYQIDSSNFFPWYNSVAAPTQSEGNIIANSDPVSSFMNPSLSCTGIISTIDPEPLREICGFGNCYGGDAASGCGCVGQRCCRGLGYDCSPGSWYNACDEPLIALHSPGNCWNGIQNLGICGESCATSEGPPGVCSF